MTILRKVLSIKDVDIWREDSAGLFTFFDTANKARIINTKDIE
jgi:hypothetical protein